MVSLMLRCTLAVALGVLAASPASAALPRGKIPPSVTLQGDEGGKVSGGSWSSEKLAGKPSIIFYVDPDESELNDHVAEALKRAELDESKFHSVAIINMDATWLPNGIIQGKLEDKQEEFPRTVYVRDNEKILVKKWGLGDDTYGVSILDSSGRCLFSHDGKLSKAQTEEVVALMRKHTQ